MRFSFASRSNFYLRKKEQNHNITVGCTKHIGIFAALYGAAKMKVYLYAFLHCAIFICKQKQHLLAKIPKTAT